MPKKSKLFLMTLLAGVLSANACIFPGCGMHLKTGRHFAKSLDQYFLEAKEAMAAGDWISAGVIMNGIRTDFRAAAPNRKGEWEELSKRVDEASKGLFPLRIDSEPPVQIMAIQGVAVGFPAAIVPKINYVDPRGIANGQATNQLALQVNTRLASRFPGYNKRFAQVLLTAFAEPPTDPNKKYERWGTVIDLATGQAKNANE